MPTNEAVARRIEVGLTDLRNQLAAERKARAESNRLTRELIATKTRRVHWTQALMALVAALFVLWLFIDRAHERVQRKERRQAICAGFDEFADQLGAAATPETPEEQADLARRLTEFKRDFFLSDSMAALNCPVPASPPTTEDTSI